MIHEFAVEPEVMATWGHFRVLWEDFGASQGRLLVEYPKSWRRQVYDLAPKSSAPVKANAICSKLADPNQRHKLVSPAGRSFDPKKSWVENAAADHGADGTFRAIVANQAGANHQQVIVADELERDSAPWKVDRQDARCPRQASEMLSRVRSLLCHSRELVLVDPHFDACEPRFVGPFEAFVGVRSDWKRLELHTTRLKSFRRDVQEANYWQKLELAVPSGVSMTVCFWPPLSDGEQVHPRFVLTELGGVHFDYGLDEGPGSTLVSLLEHAAFLQLRRDYAVESRTFGVPDVIQVTGRG